MDRSILSQLSISERQRLLAVAEARSIRKVVGVAPIEVVKSRKSLPLSYAQQGFWFIAQMEGGNEAYHIPMGVRLRGRLDRAALKRALDRIVARHEALRTTFPMVEGQPQQQIIPAAEAGFHLQEHDLRRHEDVEGELERVAAEEASSRFDLEKGPLVRGRLVQLADQEHALLITMHHIVSDWSSMSLLFKELGTLYGAFVGGGKDPLPELTVQYADYAVWQRKWIEGEMLRQQAEYWRRNLEGAPELLELAADRVRPARQDFAGGVLPVKLNERLTAGLKELGRKHGTTLYMTLLAAWAVLLGRLSGQQDVVVGTSVTNRGQVETENLIGLFANAMAVRVDVSERPTVGEVMERVKRQVLAAQQNQDVPFERVVEMLQPVRRLAHTPLFQATFTWLDALEGTPQLPGLETGALRFSPHPVSQFDIALLLHESEDRIEGQVEYATALFDAKTVKRYLDYFTRLLEGLVEGGSDQAVDGVMLLGNEERRQVVYGWNQTEQELPASCVHELFEEQVRMTPSAVALETTGRTLSYADLNAQANRLARYLRRCGAGAETSVGVCLERSIEMVVAMLGILKAGGSYVPLDVDYPAERLVFMIEDAGVGLVLTDMRLRDRLPAEATQFVPMVCIDAQPDKLDEESDDNLGLEISSDQLAYVMYTSGSMGRPKGVMVTHRNVVRLARNTNYVKFDPALVIAHVSNVVFDASTFEIWGALLNGCRLAVIPKLDVLAPDVFRTQLKDLGVTTLFLTTALFQECVRSSPGIFAGMDQILFGGEICDVECVRWSIEKQAPREVVHVYGPTETTTYASYYPVKRVDEGKAVPIGMPITNTQIYILDRHLEPVGIGVPGEICIGGVGVARGYGNNPELTATQFVPDPFSHGGGRMYRTGDLGRWREAGAIEFIGRRDEQVKIRGYRIELGEVEGALREQAGVKEAVTVVWMKESGDKQLLGYVVGEEGSTLMPAVVRDGVAKKLPEYMVPTVVVLEELPLNVNGKVDKRKLPKPEEALGERAGEYVEPKIGVEKALADIWAEVLGLKRVGAEDNFFELGGDSILCVRIVGRARERGLEITLQDVFEHQTVAALAGVARWEKSEERMLTAPFELVSEEVRSRFAEDIEDAYPLSHLQAGMLFHSGYAPESAVYHDVISYRLHLPYEAATFQNAVDRLTQRHEVLRTSIDMANFYEPMQLVHRQVDLRVVEQDWRSWSVAEQDAGVANFIEEERRKGLDLAQAPLMRIFVHRLSEDAFQYSLSFHHAILDGWSEASLVTELVQDYECRLAGKDLEVRPLPARYRDYIALERRAMASHESAAFWRRFLDGHTVTPVPLRDWGAEENSADVVVREIAMSEDTHSRLQGLARELGIPLRTVLLAAHMNALHVLSGQSDVTTGVVLNGRPEVGEAEQLAGLFLNTVPFRLRLDSRSWRSLIRETFAVEQQILPHRRYPMVQLRTQMGGEPLFETVFNYVHFHVYKELDRDKQKGPKIVGGRSGYAQTSFDYFVNFEVSADTGKMRGTVHCDTSAIGAEALERIAGYYARILAGMVEDRIGDVVPEKERSQIEAWHRTDAKTPHACVHQLFEQQVERTPDAVALVHDGVILTYGELNRRANQLGHYLQKHGVGPEVRVGICMKPSAQMVMGLLGILKAGGAYVPLDVSYPAERLGYIMRDGQVRVVVTQEKYEEQLAEHEGKVVRLDRDGEAIGREPEDAPHSGVGIENLMYVIYTSGSTGEPKGSEVPHRSIPGFIFGVEYAHFDEKTVLLQHSPVNWDALTLELWPAILKGGRCVLAHERVLGPGEVKEYVAEGVNTLLLTASLFSSIVEDDVSCLAGVRELLTGGESVSAATVKKVLEEVEEVRVVSGYGPSECTVYSSCYVVPKGFTGESRPLPIGKPIGDRRTHVLDCWLEPAPIGVMGEIFIEGPSVARGYLKRPELTAERFVPNPFTQQDGDRLFRTGDLARWRRDGNLEFLGRSDRQVKLRGYRIELGEIETALLEQPRVKQVAVLMSEDQGDKRLVAYVVLEDEKEMDELRAEVRKRLPEYMVPAAYVPLEKFPLTPNGKLDRKALPAPEGDAYVMREYESPEGEIENLLAGIWTEVLNVERVGRHDNFFDLGGHSLLAMQVVARLRALGMEAPVKEVFAWPVLSCFAEWLIDQQLASFDSGDLATAMKQMEETDSQSEVL